MQCPSSLHALVGREHIQQVAPLVMRNTNIRRRGSTARRRLDLQEIEERICRMRVVSAKWLETELAVHEDDGITCLQEVFCRCGSSCSCMRSECTHNQMAIIRGEADKRTSTEIV